MPAMMPAWSWSLPSDGDTVSTLPCSNTTGRPPYWISLARSVASLCVKLPLICTWPPENDAVWNAGFDCTTPSSTMATWSVGEVCPKDLAARALNLADPESVRFMSTT